MCCFLSVVTNRSPAGTSSGEERKDDESVGQYYLEIEYDIVII